MSIGERVYNARMRRGWSQAYLAQKAGLQPSAISHFETGNREPAFRNVVALARALHVSADYLCELDDRFQNQHALLQNYFLLTAADRKLAMRFVRRLLKS